MGNIVDKIKIDTAAEVARTEKYLSDLRKFQLVIDPLKKKRKYTKRAAIKKTAKRSPGRPKKISTVKGYKMPETVQVKEYVTTVPIEIPLKKKPGRPRKKSA